MQDRPICFQCAETVEHSPVFEAPCGHDRCRSAVFHGLCLMEHRESQARTPNRFEVVFALIRRWSREHTEEDTP